MSDPINSRERLVNWPSRQHLVTFDDIAKWHKGATYHHFPEKPTLKREGLGAIAKGWLPEHPLISTDTRVLAVGSCFAKNFTLWLAEHGFNRTFPESPYNALLLFCADFESPAVIAQQFRWAFDELDPTSLLWVDRNRQLVAATDAGKREVRATLEQTDVLILTLGLSEVWYDKLSGEPLWRALTEDLFDPERHVFRVETLTQTMEWLEAIERLRQRYLPRLKIIYTISPIPLKTTFRPISAISANSVSKAILRVALDEFLRRHNDLLNKELFYFPSYEFVMNYFIDPFREDNRHLAPIVPGMIISFFVEHYCDASLDAGRQPDSLTSLSGGKVVERVMQHASIVSEDHGARELLVRISELEEDVIELQGICDARQHVIDELDKAAKERLGLIEELQRVAEERLSAMMKLDSALKKGAG